MLEVPKGGGWGCNAEEARDCLVRNCTFFSASVKVPPFVGVADDRRIRASVRYPGWGLDNGWHSCNRSGWCIEVQRHPRGSPVLLIHTGIWRKDGASSLSMVSSSSLETPTIGWNQEVPAVRRHHHTDYGTYAVLYWSIMRPGALDLTATMQRTGVFPWPSSSCSEVVDRLTCPQQIRVMAHGVSRLDCHTLKMRGNKCTIHYRRVGGRILPGTTTFAKS